MTDMMITDEQVEAALRELTEYFSRNFPNAARRAFSAFLAAPEVGVTFQDRVQPWMMACFGPEISGDRIERGDRLLEEVFELLQSGGYNPDRILSIKDYVWGRNVGEPSQEVGGVMVTLAAYCLAHGLDMHAAGETELARIWTKVETIRAKQAAKPKHSPLPVGASPVGEWRPIETADKSASQIMLGIVRRGILEEIHIGGYRHAINADEESCWWSDQSDDEICPTHWMPHPSQAGRLRCLD